MGEIIRKMKNGKFVGWYLRYIDSDGRRKQRASKQPSHAEARRMLIEIEARIARGLVGIPSRLAAPQLTLTDLLARFVDEYRDPRIKDIGAYQLRTRKHLKRVLLESPQTAKQRLEDLTQATIARTRDALLRRYPAGTVRTTMSSVMAALNWAVREGLLKSNPGKGAKLPPSPPARLDFLTKEEVSSLLAECEQRARAFPSRKMWWVRFVAVSLAVRLGLRKGEVFGLRWQDLDLDTQRLTVARSYATTPKSGKPRPLRLPTALVPLLREWKLRCPQGWKALAARAPFPPGGSGRGPSRRRWMPPAAAHQRRHGQPEARARHGCGRGRRHPALRAHHERGRGQREAAVRAGG